MYGYVIPDKPDMFIKDFATFKANYCGMCKAIGKRCGLLMRFSTSYDVTFLNVFAHSFLQKDFKYVKHNCVLHPFKRTPMAERDELTELVVDVNTMLLYYKVLDDVRDKDRHGRKVILGKLKRKYKKALKNANAFDAVLKFEYERLNAFEKAGCTRLDEIADCFGNIMAEAGKTILKEKFDDCTRTFFYQLGRWVYFADATDDLEKDFERGNYNPLIATFGNYVDRATFIADNKEDMEYLFKATEADIKNEYDKMNITICEGMLTNIIYMGLSAERKRIMEVTKCKKIRL